MEELGRFLKESRESAKITLEEIERRTRIHRNYLRAMEAGDFHLLPGKAYARAFLRHYARVVGIDAEMVVERFSQVVEKPQHPAEERKARRTKKAPRGRPWLSKAWGWILVFLFLGAAGAFISMTWNASTTRSIVSGDVQDQLRVASQPPRLEDGLGDEMAGAGAAIGSLEESWPTGTLQSSAFEERETDSDLLFLIADDETLDTANFEPAVLQSTIENGAVSEDGAAIEDATVMGDVTVGGESAVDDTSGTNGLLEPLLPVSAPSVAGLDNLLSTTEAVDDPLPPIEGVVLDVEVRGACWFEVYADGERLFVGVLEPGAFVTWTASEHLSVRFGRPEEVYLTLNGDYLGSAGSGVITRHFYASDRQEGIEDGDVDGNV